MKRSGGHASAATIRTLLVLPCAAFFGWLGIMAVSFPGALLSGFGIKVSSPDGFSEIRAVYGGLPLMMSGLLLLGLFWPRLRTSASLGVAAASLGMAAGRLVSAYLDRELGRFPGIFLGVELTVLTALLASTLVKSEQAPP